MVHFVVRTHASLLSLLEINLLVFGKMTTGHYNCDVKRKIHREDILIAGRDIMFTKGYNATGIKDITDEMNIPKGSFYNHFTSKEEFGLEIIETYGENGTLMYEHMLLEGEGSPLTRLERFFSTLIEKYTNEYGFKLGCLMGNFSTEMADVNENFRKVLDKGFAAQEAVMAKCLKQAQDQNEIESDVDCEQMASFMINSLHGAYVRMKATESAKPLEDFKVSIFKLFR